MKVTRNEKFSPITIVIETEEEAENLWHRFNCNGDIGNYAAARGWDRLNDSYIPMFDAINNMYKPKGE